MSESTGANVELLQRMTRVETKLDGMDDKLDKALDITEIAVAAKSSADQAHKRLDKLEEQNRWLWRTFAAAFIVAAAAFILNGGIAS